MTVAPSVLVLGSTGFIGGHTLHKLITAHPSWHVTALARSAENCKAVESWAQPLVGMHGRFDTVQGDHSDLEGIRKLCETRDAVVNAATSDDLGLSKAINEGLAKARAAGKKATLVHLSGK